MPPAASTLTRNALAVALTAVATLVIRVPTPATQGYINLGDAVILAAALLFGPRAGALSGGLGSALADLLGGYAHWAPFTLFIKGLEGLLAGFLARNVRPSGRGLLLCGAASLLAVAWMVAGYFLVETFLYGWQPALAGLTGNTIQAACSLLVGLPAAAALSRAGLGENR